MKYKKLNPPSLIGHKKLEEFSALLNSYTSEKSSLKALSKIPYSPESYKLLQEKINEFLVAESLLNSAIAKSFTIYENKIKSQDKDKAQLERDNKGLLIELHKFLKVNSSSEEEEPCDTNDKTTKTDENNKATGNSTKTRKRRGAPKGHPGASRSIPSSFDSEEIINPPSTCSCGCTHIIQLDSSDDKYIEDIVPVIKVVKKVKYLQGKCTSCGKILRTKKGFSGPPVETGKNIGAMLTMMRQYGMTYGNLSKLCKDILDIPITRSGVLGIVNRYTDKIKSTYEIIEHQVSKENVLHGDETGWKVKGKSGYIWVMCNKNIVYFHYNQSRAGRVVGDILGYDYNGIVVCDFYAGYNFLENTQRCLVHFLRDTNKQCEIYKGSKALKNFKDNVKAFIQTGLFIQEMEESEEKEKKIKKLERKLDTLSNAKLPRGKPENLVKRIKKFKDQMILFVRNPNVEYHNNRAERNIRSVVIARKNSFGSDTVAGAERVCILQSVVETCKINDIQPFEFIKKAINEVSTLKDTLINKLLNR
jgi:transposase